MKPFKTYVIESAKTYDFRVRIACELPAESVDKIKVALEEYKVESVSKPKRLPIRETPEFPNLGPVEVNIIDVVLHYPTIDSKVRELISTATKISDSCIKVTPANGPYEAALAGLEQSNLQKEGESVLETPEMVTAKPEEALVGSERLEFLLKELKDFRKTYEYPEAAGGSADKTQVSAKEMPPVGTSSPVGSKQNKIPSFKK